MKVIVRRVSTGVAAVSSLVIAAGAGSVGCGGEPEGDDELLGTSEDELNPGTGRLELLPLGNGVVGFTIAASTTDEFVRVGQSLNLIFPAWVIWTSLYPNDPLPDDTRLKKLKVTIKVAVYDRTNKLTTLSLPLTAWRSTINGLYGSTGQIVIPAKADELRFAITITDAQVPAAIAVLDGNEVTKIPVFGGELPSKTLLFDNTQGVLRHRIIEGDSIFDGAKLRIGYADWRADQIVDMLSIDKQIGVAQVGGRFGLTDVPIYGKLVHEVAYAIYFNDAIGWRPEKLMTPNTMSNLLSPGRTAFESTEAVPAGVTNMQLYGHVKTYLIADYSGYANIKQKWYADGQKVLKADKYDNPNGAFTNYDFPVQ